MSGKEIVYLTPEGFLELETELNDLKINKRPEVIRALKEARALGDLSENADYDAARNEQAQLEGRIRELEYKLEHCVIAEGGSKNKIAVGSTVEVEYIGENDSETYKIVGSLEVDPLENKISNESPIGKAVMGKKVGDTVSVASPNGDFQIKIIKIS